LLVAQQFPCLCAVFDLDPLLFESHGLGELSGGDALIHFKEIFKPIGYAGISGYKIRTS
jgi:hypothetical protein